jgi:predicted ATPase
VLTRIEIDGFKTFEDFAVDLAPFAVILGSNAAGKSNLFDAIQLLSHLATQDVNEAIKRMRGEPIELFRCTEGDGYGKSMRFAVEVLIDPAVRDPWGKEVALGHTRLRYEVELERQEVRPGIDRVVVVREAATPITRAHDEPWIRRLHSTSAFRTAHLKYKRPAALLSTQDGENGRVFHLHQDGRAGRTLQRPANAAEATVLYSVTNAEFPHLFALREEMNNWRLLQLDPAVLRRPSSATAADLLAADGSNLATVLARIKAETATPERSQGVLSDIAAALNALIPSVASVDSELETSMREHRVKLTMRDGLQFSSRVVSDGTLRVLALLTLLHDKRHRGLVCFEEPENGVHPARLKQLVRNWRDMVTRPDRFHAEDGQAPLSQLLLNSHSPVVLSAFIDEELHSQSDPVFFADTTAVIDPDAGKVRRRTRMRPVMPSEQDLFNPRDKIVSPVEVRRMLDTVGPEE